MARDRSRSYPLFAAFPGGPLTRAEAAAATPDARIASIWPFLVGCVLEFQKTLKPREQTNFDPEDTLIELYLELIVKDDKYDSERGKYITFAAKVAFHALCEVRDHSRTVQSPRNSGHRLREYAAADAAGELTERRRKTAEAIRRAQDGLGEVFERDRLAPEGPPAIAVGRERTSAAQAAVRQAIATQLTALEAVAVGRTRGLWGCGVESIRELAARMGHDPALVSRARSRGNAKIRRFIQEHGGLDMVLD